MDEYESSIFAVPDGQQNAPMLMTSFNNGLGYSCESNFGKSNDDGMISVGMENDGLSRAPMLVEEHGDEKASKEDLEELNIETGADWASMGFVDVLEQVDAGDGAFVRDTSRLASLEVGSQQKDNLRKDSLAVSTEKLKQDPPIEFHEVLQCCTLSDHPLTQKECENFTFWGNIADLALENTSILTRHEQVGLLSVNEFGVQKRERRDGFVELTVESSGGCLHSSHGGGAEKQDIQDAANGLSCRLIGNTHRRLELDANALNVCVTRNVEAGNNALGSLAVGQIQSEGMHCTGVVKEFSDSIKQSEISPEVLGIQNLADRQLDVGVSCGKANDYETSLSMASEGNGDANNAAAEFAVNAKEDFKHLNGTGFPEVSALACSSGDAYHIRNESYDCNPCGSIHGKVLKQEPIAVLESEPEAMPERESEPLGGAAAKKASMEVISWQQGEGRSNALDTISEIMPEKQLDPEVCAGRRVAEGMDCLVDGQPAYVTEATGNLERMAPGSREAAMDVDGEDLKDFEDNEKSLGSVASSVLVDINFEITGEPFKIIQPLTASESSKEGGSKHNKAEYPFLGPQRIDAVVDDASTTRELKRYLSDSYDHATLASNHSEEWITDQNLRDGYIREEHDSEEHLKVENKGHVFCVGDLVWAKVKSHPWWPGQIFDSADASLFAKKVKKTGRILVAFFGDHTFGWLHQSQLIAFHPHFSEKVKQTNMKSFCKAVTEALDEVCRRVELGLRCSCHSAEFYSKVTFPDENTGIQSGVRIKVHNDISTSRENFNAGKTLELIRGLACSPFTFWNCSLQETESRGQIYAFRTATFGPKSSPLYKFWKDAHQVQGAAVEHPEQISGPNLKRKFSVGEGESAVVAGKGIRVKKMSDSQDGCSLEKDRVFKRMFSEYGEKLLPSTISAFNAQKTLAGVLAAAGKENAEVHSCKDTREDTSIAKNKRASALQLPEGSKTAKRFHLQVEHDIDESKQVLASDEDSETLIALAGHNAKLLKKHSKGRLHQGAKKQHVKTVIGNIGEQESSTSKNAQDLDIVVDQSSAVDQRSACCSGANRNSMLAHSIFPAWDMLRSQNRTPELRTKFFNDTNASTLKEVMKNSIKTATESRELKEKPLGDHLTLKELRKELSARKSPVPSSDLKYTHTHDEARFTKKRLSSPQLQGRHEIASMKQHLSSSQSQCGEHWKKTSKSSKLGECIKRIASELTGAPPMTKCLDQTSAKKAHSNVRRKSVLNKGKIVLAGEIGPKMFVHSDRNNENSCSSFLPLLQELFVLAKNPLDIENEKKTPAVRNSFLKFRDAVFQKSVGYSSLAPQATGSFLGEVEANDSMVDHSHKMTKVQQPEEGDALTDQGQHVQVASEAPKRKPTLLQDGVVKKPKKNPVLVSLTSSSSRLHRVGDSMFSHTEKGSNGKFLKHYSRRPTSALSDNMCPTQQYNDSLSSEAPVALFMKFPQGFALPSEAQLRATFIRFGQLQTSGTRVYRDSGTAQVVFKRGIDANTALKYAKENNVFGQAVVSFRLRHFSYPQRVDLKPKVSPSGKKIPSVGVGERLPSVEKAQGLEESFHSKDVFQISSSSAFKEVPKPTIYHPETPLSPHLLQAFENPITSNTLLNSDSVPSKLELGLNESHGDIKDKMIKLLRQVSVIVGSSGLGTEPS